MSSLWTRSSFVSGGRQPFKGQCPTLYRQIGRVSLFGEHDTFPGFSQYSTPLGFSTFQWLFFPRFHSKNLHQGRENWEMGRAGEWNDEKNQRSLSRFFASLRP
jgi:hypothetical protein